ncbi:uncharacterized protein PAC_17241 [Phialocephala subalpina]|uniref:Peptidase C14 caspase domain-containing protein n=1 Tax=Phialocephala subalpina TaxID=576137 RepID=A0A1L7XQL4_9HELO|nr:uncharacterized protein PAC_17241 [Phialocephala subalpina]
MPTSAMSDNELFITLSAGDNDSGDDLSLADDRSFTSATHDTRRTKYHTRDLSTFAKHLEHAAASVFPNKGQPRYQTVRVLLLRWEEDSLGVKHELDNLASTFRHYGYDTETWLIPTVKSHNLLMKKALQILDDYGSPDDLLIVYYAGHGRMNASRRAEWTCVLDNKTISLQWHAVQTLFEDADSDVLLLLDCCAAVSGALAGVNNNNNNVTETIAACGFETWAPLPGRHSFTETLTSVLKEWYDRPAFTAAMLHCEILNRLRHEKPEYRGSMKFEYRKSPIHVLSTNDPKARSVELAPRHREPLPDQHVLHPSLKPARGRGTAWSSIQTESDILNYISSKESDNLSTIKSTNPDPYNMDSLTRTLKNGELAIPHVLISLALEEEQLLDINQCRKWLQDFPAMARFVTVQGVYRSNSTLLLLSVPVPIWDMLPSDPACVFVGYVHSQNMLNPTRSPQAAVDGPELKRLNEVCPRSRADRPKPRLKAYQWVVCLLFGLLIALCLAWAMANWNGGLDLSLDSILTIYNELLYSNLTTSSHTNTLDRYTLTITALQVTSMPECLKFALRGASVEHLHLDEVKDACSATELYDKGYFTEQDHQPDLNPRAIEEFSRRLFAGERIELTSLGSKGCGFQGFSLINKR